MRTKTGTHMLRAGTLLLCLVATTGYAQEFRSIRPIPTPPPVRAEAKGSVFRPVAREQVESAINGLFAAWNTPQLMEHLSAQFYGQTRLPDTLAVAMPRDATIRVLGLEAWDTLDQEVVPARPDGLLVGIRSTVAVRVRSQLEFNDPEEGFQNLEGVNQYVLEIKTIEAL